MTARIGILGAGVMARLHRAHATPAEGAAEGLEAGLVRARREGALVPA